MKINTEKKREEGRKNNTREILYMRVHMYFKWNYGTCVDNAPQRAVEYQKPLDLGMRNLLQVNNKGNPR